jgi:hypothetical protein
MPVVRDGLDSDDPFLAEVLAMAGRGHLPRGAWELTFPVSRMTRAL